MQNIKLLAGVILGTLVLVFGVAWMFSQESAPAVFDENLVVGEANNVRTSLSSEVEGEEVEGSESSESGMMEEVAVTIVEFSDFQCPACKASEPLVQQVLSENEGSVRVVYRHFPLEQIHEHARIASIMSEVMADKGMFWEYHDLLFDRQEDWAVVGSDEIEEVLVGYAQELGVDGDEVRESLGDPIYEDRVNTDVNAARALGVNATPTFFVNGQKAGATELASLVTSML